MVLDHRSFCSFFHNSIFAWYSSYPGLAVVDVHDLVCGKQGGFDDVLQTFT